jgi:hypothetical protein
MTRTVAAAMVAAAIWSYHSTARGQPAIIGMQDADPPAPPACCCRLAPGDPEEVELTAVIAASATVVAVSHLLAIAFIANQHHGLSAIDPIPVIGTIIAAQRNALDDRTVPLLLFSAGVQAIGILVVGMASAELAQRHRLLVDAFASSSGAGISIGWRY